MISFTNIVTAYLSHGEDFLMMKRAPDKEPFPNYWYGVGGHVKEGESRTPGEAIFREIREETGLERDQIENLRLGYILLRREGETIVVNSIYFGEAQTREVTPNEEGTLHWVNKREAPYKKAVDALQKMLEHYVFQGESSEVLVGVTRQTGENPEETFLEIGNMEDKS